VKSVAELPEEIQKKLKDLNLDEEKLLPNWKKFMFVLRYITKKQYTCPDLEIPVKDRTPFVDPELQSRGVENIKTVEKQKELKKQYKFIVNNGKGGFGKVITAKVKNKEKGKGKEIVAIKKLPVFTPDEDLNNICEVSCLVLLKHTNVVDFKMAYRLPHELWIVMEYMEGGTLNHAIRVHSFCESHIAYILQQIITGLDYIHSQGFAHRDLKSNNIMISIKGEIKIIDFGICAQVTNPRQQMIGTVYYMAPEVILRRPHNAKCDIWSLGIVIIELYLLGTPYGSSKLLSLWRTVCGETIQVIQEELVKISTDSYSLAKSCLVCDPEERPSASDLRKIPYIANAALDHSFFSCLKTIFISLTMHRSGF